MDPTASPAANPAASGAPPPKKKSKSPIVLIAIIGMCVLSVPCVGILAAVAIPSFIGYVRRSKVAEAESNLSALAAGTISYCQATGRLPGPAGPLPVMPTSQKQVVDFFGDPNFAAVGFSVADPVYYSYAIEPDGFDGSVTLAARGDLDGDGMLSRFTIVCRPDCTCGTTERVDELE